MTTRIVVQEYLGKELELTYTIAQQIFHSGTVNVHKAYPGYPGLDTNLDLHWEKYMDELTLKGVTIGLKNKIHIFSLTPEDKMLFENLRELPKCIEFKVEPGVNLSIIPRIHNQEYKTDKCPICWKILFTTEEGGLVMGLSEGGCGHKFHRDCLLKSLRINNSCPICRKKIMDILPIPVDSAESESGGRRKKTKKGKKTKKTKKNRKTKGMKITKSR